MKTAKSERRSTMLVEQNIPLAFSGPVDQVRTNDALITQHLGVF
jgi:hypothetical protein